MRDFLVASLSSASPEDVEAGFLSSDVSALASLVRFLRCCDLALVALGTSTWFSIGEHGCSRTFSFISSELWPEIGTGTTSSAAGFICSPTVAVLEIFSDSGSNSLLALDLPVIHLGLVYGVGLLPTFLNTRFSNLSNTITVISNIGLDIFSHKFSHAFLFPRVVKIIISKHWAIYRASISVRNPFVFQGTFDRYLNWNIEGPTTPINVLLWYTLASHSQHQQRANFIEGLIHRIKETPNTALLRHLLEVVSKGLQLRW
nr:hypothetical protein Itr_chr05CG06670 [Ipomoea trifida]